MVTPVAGATPVPATSNILILSYAMKNEYIPDTVKGWNYISALFYFFQNRAKNKSDDSYVFPKYIYRGVSRRHFTESKSIDDVWSTFDVVYNEKKKGKRVKLHLASLSEPVKQCVQDGLKDAEAEMEKYKYHLEMMDNRIDAQAFRLRSIKKNIYFRMYSKLLDLINEKTLEESEVERYEDQLKMHINLLESIVKEEYYVLTEPEQIRSGASVRLRDIDGKYCSFSDYIKYVTNLITEFKTLNPKYKNYSDIEVLAEIQHKGGASCLVDFSNNFLISLWFACSNDFEHVGYLFCLDTNSAIIKDDNISILHPSENHKDNESIESILARTRKSARYLGEDNSRFWLWRPFNLNGRIGRQDSVFIFGLEKFNVKAQGVEVIPIPPKWKEPIVAALKTFFGLSAETIFPDEDGFASANSKLATLPNSSCYFNPSIHFGNKYHNLALDVIQRGMTCFLEGKFNLALDYFFKSLQEEEVFYKVLNENGYNRFSSNQYMIKLEVLYSIGCCYKYKKENWEALEYLRKAFVLCYNLITGYRLDEDLKNIENQKYKISKDPREKINIEIFQKKFLKIVDEYMDLIYDVQRYAEGLTVLPLLLEVPYLHGAESRNILCCVKNCMMILNAFKKSLVKGEPIKSIRFESLNCKNDSYCYILDQYFKFIQEIVSKPQKVIANKGGERGEECNYGEEAYTAFKKCSMSSKVSSLEVTNMYWEFDDLVKAINSHFSDEEFTGLRELVNQATSRIIKIQKMIQSRKDVNK